MLFLLPTRDTFWQSWKHSFWPHSTGFRGTRRSSNPSERRRWSRPHRSEDDCRRKWRWRTKLVLREEADVDRFEVMEPGGSPKYLQSVGQAAVQIAPASTKVLTCIQAAPAKRTFSAVLRQTFAYFCNPEVLRSDCRGLYIFQLPSHAISYVGYCLSYVCFHWIGYCISFYFFCLVRKRAHDRQIHFDYSEVIQLSLCTISLQVWCSLKFSGCCCCSAVLARKGVLVWRLINSSCKEVADSVDAIYGNLTCENSGRISCG